MESKAESFFRGFFVESPVQDAVYLRTNRAQDFWRWRYLELSEKVADGSHEPPPACSGNGVERGTTRIGALASEKQLVRFESVQHLREISWEIR